MSLLNKFLKTFLPLFLFNFLLSSYAFAATLYLSPATASHAVGSTFITTVYVDSTNTSINAVSGIINFPKDKIEVVSVSKTNTILGFWAQEPTFSNSEGTISFEGVILNP